MERKFGLLIMALILTACASTTTEADKEERFSTMDRYLTITTDKETGCKYIVYSEWSGYGAAGGITPLMQNNGKQDCE